MTDESHEVALFANSSDGEVIRRSSVPPMRNYRDYKEFLRSDFFYQCAYCTMGEYEASAVRFTIDHYEPVHARPDLELNYDNLMYSCDQCNTLKGDRHPSSTARQEGYSFFRPDQHKLSEHFSLDGVRVKSNTNVGYFTIECVGLNRQALRRLRAIRIKLNFAMEGIVAGVLGLRSARLDRLPPDLRGRAKKAITSATKSARDAQDALDEILRSFAKSQLVDPDPEKVNLRNSRMSNVKQLLAAYPKKVSSNGSTI